jgi:hypothetical protein
MHASDITNTVYLGATGADTTPLLTDALVAVSRGDAVDSASWWGVGGQHARDTC